MGGLSFGKDGDGNYGYYGADGSLVPFKRTEIISCGTIGFHLSSTSTLNISSILAEKGYKTTDITIDNVFLRPDGRISSRAKKNSSDTAITTGFTLSYEPSTGVVSAYCGDVSYQQSFGINFNVFVVPTT